MTALLSLLLLAAAPGAQDPALDRAVALDLDALPLPKLAAKIATQAGIKLEAEPALGRRVVFVRTGPTRLGDTLERIAAATDSRLEGSEGAYRFVRDPERERASRAVSLADRVKTVRTAFDRLKQASDGEYTAGNVATALTAESARKESGDSMVEMFLGGSPLQGVTPYGRAMSRALEAVGPEAVAGLKVGDRVVYSTEGTRVQRPFPLDFNSFYEAYKADEAVFSDAMKILPNRPPGVRSPAGQPAMEAVGARLVIIQSSMFGFALTFAELQFVNAKGEWPRSQPVMVGVDPLLTLVGSIGGARAGSIKVAWRPESRRQLRLLSLDTESMEGTVDGERATSDEGRDPAPNPKDDPVAHSPDLYEPLSLAPSDFLRDYAVAKGVDLVASLTDVALLLPALGAAGAADLPLIEEVFLRQMSRVVEQGDGVLVVGPRHPGLAEESFVDRTKLGAYLRACAAASGPTLDARVEFIGNRGTDTPGLIEMFYRMIFEQEGGMFGLFGMSEGVDEAAMFLGRLTKGERAALAQGNRIGIATLTQAQRAPLNRLVYGLAGAATIHAKSAQGEGALALAEPTVLAPAGLPVNGSIQMKAETEPVYGIQIEDWTEWSTVEELAEHHADKIRSGQGTRAALDQEKFLLGAQNRYEFRVWLSETYYIPVPFEETVRDPRGIEVSVAGLPPAQRERYEKALRESLAQRTEPEMGEPLEGVEDPS